MKKLKLKKEAIFVIAILVILIIIITIYFLLHDKSYEVEYEVNGLNVRENYNDKDKIYTFEISHNNIKYTFYQTAKYHSDQKFIKDIEIINIDKEECLKVDSSFEIIPLCKNKDEAIDYRLTSVKMKEELGVKEIEEELKEYENYKIYNTLGYKIILWDYKNIINIGDDITKTNILTSDSYNFDLAVKLNEYILIPDYDSKYSFNKFYIYNILDGTKETMTIDYNISYDSYILGTFENSIYLVDKKNKIEYEIVPFKKKIRKVGTSSKKGIILTEKGFEKISLTKLCNENMHFYKKQYYNYQIEDNKLYQISGNSKTRISDKEVKNIIRVEDDNVLYIVDDTLYLYNLKYGSVKLISNFEWKFNYKDLMFLYIP